MGKVCSYLGFFSPIRQKAFNDQQFTLMVDSLKEDHTEGAENEYDCDGKETNDLLEKPFRNDALTHWKIFAS